MIARERVIAALKHEPLDRVPRDLWIAPAVAASRPDEVAEIELRFPWDVERAVPSWDAGRRQATIVPLAGDPWWCGASSASNGAVREPPLASLDDAARYRPPRHALDRRSLEEINRLCLHTSRFVLGQADARPFERLGSLLGPQVALDHLLRDDPRIRALLIAIHAFHCEEMRLWAASEVDGVVFQDTLTAGERLVMPPVVWQEVIAPYYQEYCEILRDGDKFVLFEGGGNLADIFGELIETGVDAICTQLPEASFELLAAQYRGRVTFWGGTAPILWGSDVKPDRVREAVRRVRRALDQGRGGVVAHCAWGPDLALNQVVATFDEWMRPLPAHAG